MPDAAGSPSTAVPEVWLLPTGQVAIRDAADTYWVVEPETEDRTLHELPADAVRLVPERDGKVVELTITRAVLAQQTRKRDEARAERDAAVAAVRGLVDNYAAHDQQAFEAAHEAAIAVLAGGSAPHQGATTTEDEKVRQIAAATLRAEATWWELVRPQSVGRTQFGTWLRGRADVWATGEGHAQAEVRALLGAGETTEADQ